MQSLQYVEMKDFLPDNIALARRMEARDAPDNSPSSSHPRLWEVSSILSWVSCFTTYVAVLLEAHPELVKSQLAYLTLMIAEARCNGGDGWLTYDTIFCQKATEDSSIVWDKLDPSLHMATFAALNTSPGSVCPHCSASDHAPKDCVLRSLSRSGGQQGQ